MSDVSNVPHSQAVDVSNKTGPSSGGWEKDGGSSKFVKGEGDGSGSRWMVQGWPVTRQVIITFEGVDHEKHFTTPTTQINGD